MLLTLRSLPRTLKGVGGARLINMPGVKHAESALVARKGTDARSGLPYTTPPPWGISTHEAAELLGITPRATRALLTRHKSKHHLVARPGHCACMYWERRMVERMLALRMPMVSSIPDKFCSAHEACVILVVGRSTLSRYVKRGLLKEYHFRHATATGVRLLAYYLRADVRKLVARRNAARARAEAARVEQLRRLWNRRDAAPPPKE